MLTKLLKSKLHNVVVRETEVNYHGSIRIDSDLLRAAGMLPNEAVLVVDCDNGERFETYIIPGQAGSGVIGVFGAAARLTKPGNRVIVMSFVYAAPADALRHTSRVVLVDANNKPAEKIEHDSRLE